MEALLIFMPIVSVLRKAKFSGIRLLSFEESKKKDKIKQGMKKLFILSFFLHGLISIIAQVIILRELMTTFYGNELFMATTLGFWLLGSSLGSFLAHKIPSPKISLRNIPSLNLILLALGLPTEIFLIRLFKGKFFLPGEIPNFLIGFVFAFLTLLSFCAILNAFFTLGTRFWADQKKKREIPKLVGQAYLWETIGLATGGLVFNFLLIRLTEFRVLFFLSALSFCLATILGKQQLLKWGGLVASCLVLLLVFSPFSSALNTPTLKFIHPLLVESVNSKYGKITVTSSGAQFNFFESGNLVGTNQDTEGSEYLVHFLFTFHQNPKKILLIGGGFNGVISEILKYKTLERIDYLELDPLFLGTIKKYLPPKIKTDLENPKVNILYADGRAFLKTTSEKYDLILLNLPNPSTALLNRFYTKECFEETKKLLQNDGILATTLELPVDYLSREAESLVSSVYWTQRKVFPFIEIFPEETLVLFLSSKTIIPTDDIFLKDIFENRDISTDFFTSEDIYYRIKSDHIPRFEAIFRENYNIKQNFDFSPAAYFYQTAFWQTQFSFPLAKIFGGLANLNWLFLFLFLIVFPGLLVKKLSDKNLAITFVAFGGFILMTFETLIIFAFQATLGFIFAKVSLIFTTVLVSMALGNLLSSKFLAYTQRILRVLPLGIIFYCFIFINLISKIPTELVFYFLSALIGLLVGSIFPLANQVYLEKDKKAILKTGVLYSADLGGAFAGATLTSLFLIPILGLEKIVWLLALLNGLLFLSPKKLGR